MISKSKILLASTALIAVAGTASAADTAVNTSGAVTTTDATQLTLTDADTSGSVNTGDTISTDSDIAAELTAGNTGVVITSSVAGTTLAVDHDVTTTGATAVDQSAAGTINVATGVTVTGATNAILVSGDVATTTTVDGTLSGAFDASAAATAATALTVNTDGTVGAVTIGDGAATVIVEGTAGAVAMGAGTNSLDVRSGGTVASVTGTGTDTLLATAGVGTVTGDVEASVTTVTGDLVVGGTAAPTAGLLVGGAFVSDDTTATNITVNSGATATVGGTSAAETLTVGGDLTIASGTTTISGGTATTDVTGNITVGAVAGGTGAHLVAGTLADVDAKVKNITLELGTNLTESGTLTTTSNLDFNKGTVGLKAARGVTLTDETGMDLAGIVTAGAAADITGTTLSTGNALYAYEWTKGSATTYDLNVKLKDASVTTLEGAASAGFKALAAQLEDTDGTTGSTNAAELYKKVFAQEDTEKALESVSSDVSGGLSQTLINAVQGTAKSVDSRQASLRGQSGVAAGNMTSNGHMWVKAFGTTSNQDAQTGSAGYDGETFGVTYGVDSENIVEGATVGLAVSYADSNVDTAAGSDTDVTSYQITGYGSKDLGDRTYVDTQLGFAYNDYESSRVSLGDTYTGDFDGFQVLASIEAGRSYDWKGATVTPKAGLQYILSSTETYTETGTGSNALTVDNEDVSALYARVGADIAWDMSTESGIQYRPFVKAALSYDLIGDDAEARSSFSTGNAFTVTGAEAEEFAVELGAGVEVFSTNGVDVTLGYDAVLKDNYDAHTGSVKARWAF